MKNNEIVMKFGLKVKFEREKQKISQEELAEIACISKNSVGKIERGEVNCTLLTVHTLAKALKVPVEELINPTKIDL